ncbi:MAG: MnhB domain-containing protein [Candidatus Velthaea sp.]
MNPRVRNLMTASAGAVLVGFMLWGFAALPAFGTYNGAYGTILNTVAPHERQIPNIITAVNFDYRGLDTLGEEYILFAAVAGLALVLRRDSEQTTEQPLPPSRGRGAGERSDALQAFGVLGIGTTVAFGAYVALHPHLTPGGGFQGGTITAGFVALTLLGVGYRPFARMVPQGATETLEAIGAGAYAAIGVVTLIAGGAFLANVLPLGGEGQFFSTGTIALINLCVAVEVCAGFAVVFVEFARETRVEEDAEG